MPLILIQYMNLISEKKNNKLNPVGLVSLKRFALAKFCVKQKTA